MQDWGFQPEEIEAPPNRVTLEYTQLLLSVARGPQVDVQLILTLSLLSRVDCRNLLAICAVFVLALLQLRGRSRTAGFNNRRHCA